MYNYLIQKNGWVLPHSQIQRVDFSSLNEGLGPLFILYIVYQLLEQRKLSIDDVVDITDAALKETGRGIVGYEPHDRVNLLQVLMHYKVTAGVDSLFLLANHVYVKTQKRMSEYFDDLIQQQALSAQSAKNLSGKKNSKFIQQYTLNDVLKIANLFTRINPFYLESMAQSKIAYKGKNFLSSTFLLDQGKATYFFNFLNISIAWLKQEGGSFSIAITQGIDHSFHQDSVLERLFLDLNHSEGSLLKPEVVRTFQQDKTVFNIIGDTYLGEYYTERRRKRKVFDPLIEHGYDYSFEKLKSFLLAADVNLANHEACFIDQNIPSPLVGLKKFILGAQDQKTVQALKKANIHYLCLANNHTADFGAAGITHTIKTLNEADIHYTGVGENEFDACKPIRFKVNGRVISFYSGYWHRATNEKIFKFYATPSSSGVATLESVLYEAIALEKNQHPEHFIVVLAHWGVDFLPTHAYQKRIAKRLMTAGTDLILGHGAHTLQSIDSIDEKTVVYSLGNGIFNSDGEYDGYPDALPFGMIAQMIFEQDTLVMRLMPIESNNRETLWQPNFVQLDAFHQIAKFFDTFQFDRTNSSTWPYYFEKKIL